MLPQYFVILSPILSFTASYFYIKSVIKRETIPNKVGWFIWMLAPIVSSFIILKNGGGISAVPVFMSWIIPLIVLIFSFRIKSEIKITKLDIICLISALVAMYFWLLVKDVNNATIFAIISDGLGFIPIIVKSWKYPGKEKPWPYLAGVIGASLSLLTLNEFSFHLYSFPLYLIIGNLILISVIYFKRAK